ncbi:MAG: cytochrome P450 [Nitrospira sp.]|nr:cytochrome P450 [Nitrospira sp.]
MKPSHTLVDVPGGEPLLGHLRAFRRRPLQAMSQWWRRHGDALRFRLGPKTLYLLSHPDLAEEILVHQADCFVKVYERGVPPALRVGLGVTDWDQFGRGSAAPAHHPAGFSSRPHGGDGRA